jgi:hypothetical protein
VKKHYNRLTFLGCRLLTAIYLLERVPYWYLKGVLRREERRAAFDAAKTCWLGCRYALGDWTRLLMNREKVLDTL